LTAIKIEELPSSYKKEDFNRIVAKKPQHSILQSWEWGELKETFGWKPHRLLINADQETEAVTILERKTSLFPISILYSPHLSLPHKVTITAIREFLREEYNQGVAWKVEPVESVSTDMLPTLGFKPGGRIQPKTTLQLDLSLSEEELSAGLELKTRYNIGLAERRGVEVREEKGERGWETFIELLLATSERKGFLIHTADYYRRMYELFVRDGGGMIVNGYYEGKPTASAFILRFGDYAYYSLGASSPQYARHKSSQLVQWRAILWAKADGAKIYDFWGIPESPSPKSHLFGVYTFKKGFGGRVVQRSGAYDLPLRRGWFGVWKMMVGVYNGLRNFKARGSFRDPLED